MARDKYEGREVERQAESPFPIEREIKAAELRKELLDLYFGTFEVEDIPDVNKLALAGATSSSCSTSSCCSCSTSSCCSTSCSCTSCMMQP